MIADDNPETASLKRSFRTPHAYRFQLKSRGKPGPSRSKFGISLRNRRIATRVAELISRHGPGSYDAAIKTVADETGKGEQTIRDAYDRTRKSDQGKRSTK